MRRTYQGTNKVKSILNPYFPINCLLPSLSLYIYYQLYYAQFSFIKMLSPGRYRECVSLRNQIEDICTVNRPSL
jgi:hypothetical protein